MSIKVLIPHTRSDLSKTGFGLGLEHGVKLIALSQCCGSKLIKYTSGGVACVPCNAWQNIRGILADVSIDLDINKVDFTKDAWAAEVLGQPVGSVRIYVEK